MRKKRSRLKIMVTILQAIIEKKQTITHIMYFSNISFSQASVYLQLLQETELIQKLRQGDNTIYEITKKGQELVETYKQVEELMEIPQ
jgi:predicted transcriptional regulator